MPNSEWIELSPKGFRDVYWCWLLNEPVIIEYRNDVSWCRCCEGDILSMPNEHTFILHILKPSADKYGPDLLLADTAAPFRPINFDDDLPEKP